MSYMSKKIFLVERKPSVKKDIKKLPQGILSICFGHLEKLKNDPVPYNAKALKGLKHYYKIRVASYRIIYHVNFASKIITILAIDHRKDVYDRITL